MAAVIAVAALSPLALPYSPNTDLPDLPLLVEQYESRARTDRFSDRPAYLPRPDGPTTFASPPAPLATSVLVSKVMVHQDQRLPYLVPDTALPFRYHVDRKLADRYGLEQVVEAMAQWDGIPGSRWATEFVSVVDHTGKPRTDGASVVFLDDRCPDRHLGAAYWNAAPPRGQVDLRYGAEALYSSQIDIGICTSVSAERLPGVVAHEVGHAMGMAHLCKPGDELCNDPEMFDPEPRCRAMYYRFGPCRDGLAPADHDAARHLYPTLPRLFGPTVADTAARASFATGGTHDARDVVLARTDGDPYVPVIGAALSGALNAPLLLSETDPDSCLEPAARDELARVAAAGARLLLLGDWPDGCADRLGDWRLHVEEIPETNPAHRFRPAAVVMSVAAAEIVAQARKDAGGGPESAYLLPLDDHPDAVLAAVAAAAAAGRAGVPLLVTDGRVLSGPVDLWIAGHPTVQRLDIVSRTGQMSPSVDRRLFGLGTVTLRHPVTDPVAFSIALANRQWPLALAPDQDPPVLVGPVDSAAEAATAASLAGRMDAPLLLSGYEEHPDVSAWLGRRNGLTGGFVVGAPQQVAYETQWRYSTQAGPGDPAPRLTDRERPWVLGGAGRLTD